jgi:hypothetical protein
VLADPPAGLVELRGVLLRDLVWLRGEGLAQASRAHPAYGASVTATGVFALSLAVVATTGASGRAATTEYNPLSTFRPATRAEKRATRPVAEAVLRAYRTGNLAALCVLVSPPEVKRVYGTPSRCQRALRRVKHRCSDRCEFRSVGAFAMYLTARDKALHRTSLAWVHTMRDPRQSGHGEIEIRFRKEKGRWILLPDIVESWSG